VRDGGTLILGPRSGVKDKENAIVNELLPGLLRKLAGCTVEEYDAFSDVSGLEMRVQDGEGKTYGALALADVLVPEGDARALLTYADHYYVGRAAAVENRLGRGRCIYVGTVLDDAGTGDLLRTWILKPASMPCVEGMPESIEVSQRVKGEQRYTFYLNHSAAPVTVTLAVPGLDLLTGQPVDGRVEIAGFDLLIVKEKL
jgi:beta-galactosidase